MKCTSKSTYEDVCILSEYVDCNCLKGYWSIKMPLSNSKIAEMFIHYCKHLYKSHDGLKTILKNQFGFCL